MLGDTQDISCDKCGKCLFTEYDTETGYKRENDSNNYRYDEINDLFLCNECMK